MLAFYVCVKLGTTFVGAFVRDEHCTVLRAGTLNTRSLMSQVQYDLEGQGFCYVEEPVCCNPMHPVALLAQLI